MKNILKYFFHIDSFDNSAVDADLAPLSDITRFMPLKDSPHWERLRVESYRHKVIKPHHVSLVLIAVSAVVFIWWIWESIMAF